MPPPSTLPFPAPPSAARSAAGAGASSAGRRIRVLVVDDSAVIRRFLTRILAEAPGFEVVGFAADGVAAVAQACQLQPDVITMDIEMPEMDGVATVRELRRRASKAVIIMCSTLTSRGATATIEALIAGANDYVTKPSGSNSMDVAFEALRQELIPKIKQFFIGRDCPPLTAAPSSNAVPETTIGTSILSGGIREPRLACAAVLPREQRRIVAIGVSTGGPTALMQLLPALPANFSLPIVIVQHMPPVFTRQMAERLSAESRLEVVEAAEGMALKAGRVMIAPGDYHLRLERSGQSTVARLDQSERENSCRPSVDVLFRSVAQLYGGHVLGIVLTGMGQDGLRGSETLKENGAYIMAQDRATSVVWSMPGAVAEAGLANAILPIGEMAKAMVGEVPSR